MQRSRILSVKINVLILRFIISRKCIQISLISFFSGTFKTSFIEHFCYNLGYLKTAATKRKTKGIKFRIKSA